MLCSEVYAIRNEKDARVFRKLLVMLQADLTGSSNGFSWFDFRGCINQCDASFLSTHELWQRICRKCALVENYSSFGTGLNQSEILMNYLKDTQKS